MKAKYILLILALAIFSCKAKREKVVDLNVDVAPQDTVEIATPAPQPEPVPEIIEEGVNPDDKYFLVVNSYTVKGFAEYWKKEYQQQGYKADLVMKNDDGFYRVALKSFNKLEDAKKALNKLHEKPEFTNVWIMVK